MKRVHPGYGVHQGAWRFQAVDLRWGNTEQTKHAILLDAASASVWHVASPATLQGIIKVIFDSGELPGQGRTVKTFSR